MNNTITNRSAASTAPRPYTPYTTMTAADRISKNGLLCVLRTGAWRPNRRHKAATNELNAQKHTSAGRVNVVLSEHPLLKQISDLDAGAVNKHRELTQPSPYDGMRLLPAGLELQHSAAMTAFSSERARLARDFVHEVYWEERSAAPARLGDLFDARHWPSTDQVGRKFKFEWHYHPLPTEGTWQNWLKECEEEIRADIRARFSEAVCNMADQLSKEKPRIFDSLVGNIEDLVNFGPDWNMMEDPRIAHLIAETKDLTLHTTAELRDNPALRATVASRAAEVAKMFNL